MFRLGINGFNEELGRYRGRDDNKEYLFCGTDCVSVSHVLWDCLVYSESKAALLLQKLQIQLRDSFAAIESLGTVSFILGNELSEKTLLHAWVKLRSSL